MNSTERHHLKENELAHLVGDARDLLGARRGPVLGGLAVVLVAGVAALGYTTWKGRLDNDAQARLAAAMAVEEARVAPPAAFSTQPQTGLTFPTERDKRQAALAKFKDVADAYPRSDAGVFARYHQASTLMALGQAAEAATAFQQVITDGGSSPYASMAKLGLAEAQAQSGQVDAALTTFRDLVQRKDDALPIDGLLMRLGQLSTEHGKSADAQQAFSRVVNEFPESPFLEDAKASLAKAAAAPRP